MHLAAFRRRLVALLPDPYARPFVCDGSPLDCRAFVVSFNAATLLREPFAAYWHDDTGFDRVKFRRDREAARGRNAATGSRRVIELVAAAVAPCLETNLYATPTPDAAGLSRAKRTSDVFEFLFREVRPQLVIAHSRKPVAFFEKACGRTDFVATSDAAPWPVRDVAWQGHRFRITGRVGGLFTMSDANARARGAELAAFLD